MAKKYDKKNSTATKPVNLITLLNPNSPISEQYRTVRTNLQFAVAGDQPLRSMAVVSSGPGEGKSTSSANLASRICASRPPRLVSRCGYA